MPRSATPRAARIRRRETPVDITPEQAKGMSREELRAILNSWIDRLPEAIGSLDHLRFNIINGIRQNGFEEDANGEKWAKHELTGDFSVSISYWKGKDAS